MTIRFRQLQLRAQTKAGAFGVDLKFESGLNVLWADNTMGKSTCMQGLLYALGMERMLSPRREIPLTYVMTSHLDDPQTRERHNVLESSVWVEIENSAGEVMTIRRNAVSPTDYRLISTFDGALLTNPSAHYQQRDYFALDPGAAQREAGFHHRLANFVGWQLPMVRRYDGGESPLYLETIFPLLYVEQKGGWSHLPAAFPSYFQIRDVSRRSVEFILGLQTHDLELRRQQIDSDLVANTAAWAARREALNSLARPIGARVEGLATAPVVAADEIARVHLLVPDDGEWKPIETVAAELRRQIADMHEREVPTSGEIAPEIERELVRLTELMAEQNQTRGGLFRARITETGQLASVLRRLTALEEDLKKNLDAQKLRQLGSTISDTFAADHCPTCAQPISDTLLAQQATSQVMPIEDNIEFIRAQKGLFQRMSTQSRSAIDEIERRLAAANADVNETAAHLRALRNDLVAPSCSPSVAALEDRLRLEAKVRALDEVNQAFEEQKAALVSLGRRHAELLEAKMSLPEDRFTPTDREKLTKFTELIRTQVNMYGFSTFPCAEIDISEDSFQPQKEGFDIVFELSASDSIRLKWAYQLALMEVARTHRTNHAGFVIFDEPRQQETAKLSFKSLLQRAATAKAAGQQVIFATSEDRSQLESFLANIDCNYLSFDGQMLSRRN